MPFPSVGTKLITAPPTGSSPTLTLPLTRTGSSGGIPSTTCSCASSASSTVVIFSAGFGEVGAEGEAEQERIRKLSRENGMRVLGPNCLGIMNLKNGVLASFASEVEIDPASPQTLGFVAQSGALGAILYAEATRAGVGFTSFTSVGNEADTEFSDFVEYLLEDADTKLVAGYLEGALP